MASTGGAFALSQSAVGRVRLDPARWRGPGNRPRSPSRRSRAPSVRRETPPSAAGGRRGSSHSPVDGAREYVAGVLVADGVADVCLPPDRVAGLNSPGSRPVRESALGATSGLTPRTRPGFVPRRPSSATSAGNAQQQHVGNAVRDRDQPQRPVAQSLPRQRRPASIGAEDAAVGGRKLASLQPVCLVERKTLA